MKSPNGIEGVRAALDDADNFTMPDLDVPDEVKAEVHKAHMDLLKREYYGCKMRKAVAFAIDNKEEAEEFERRMADYVRRIVALEGLKVLT